MSEYCRIIKIKYICSFSWDSAVGIATDYGLDGLRDKVRVPVESRIFSTSSRPTLGPTQPPTQWVTEVLTQEVKRPGRETDYSPPTFAKNKKKWIFT
jgi:hypothetical protein